MSGFEQELEQLINKYSIENGSDTPDFILVGYIMGCLAAWNNSIQMRDKWYGFRTLGTMTPSAMIPPTS